MKPVQEMKHKRIDWSQEELCSMCLSVKDHLKECPLRQNLWVSLDPGINCCGLATWDGEVLLKAQLVKNQAVSEDPLERALGMAEALRLETSGGEYKLVSEIPQFYSAGKSKGDPNKLALLSMVVASFAGVLDPSQCKAYLPAEWKGQKDKAVLIEVIKFRLTEKEASSLVPCAPSLMHNVWDAVGIGLHHVGRLRQRILATG